MIAAAVVAVFPGVFLLYGDNPYWSMGCFALLVLCLSAPVGPRAGGASVGHA